MTEFENRAYVTELHGTINGEPRAFEMDVKRVLASRYERAGIIISDADSDEKCQKLFDDTERMKAPKTVRLREVSIKGIFSRWTVRRA